MIAATPTYMDATESPRHKISPILKNGLLTFSFSIAGARPVNIFDPTSATKTVKIMAAAAVLTRAEALTLP
jgi:hypothetical protein